MESKMIKPHDLESTIWHTLPVASVIQKLNSNIDGLSEQDAVQRIELFGPNILKEKEKISVFRLFIDQFNNYLIIILLFAVILSAIVGELIDSIVILIIIVFAAGLGFIQEYRSEKAIGALMKMTEPTATVIRNGKEIIISTDLLVPGDIIPVSIGVKIPADARLIESYNLQTNEASLTGESTAVDKNFLIELNENIPLGNRENMIYTGTIVTYGRGLAIVVATAMKTEFGQIASLLDSVKSEQTPLQKNLDQLGKTLAKVSFSIIFILFILSILQGHDPLERFVWAIALAIAVVPEALPAVVTISLAIGVQKMSKRNALIRKLSAVETLGATSIICTDKTGTLTKGEMYVRKIYYNGGEYDITSFKTISGSNQLNEAKYILLGSTLCNDAKLPDSGNFHNSGSPTEIALKIFASEFGYNNQTLADYSRIDEIPFTSEQKMMTTVYKNPKEILVFSKGAPEYILLHCKGVMENGKISPISEVKLQQLKNAVDALAKQALRIIAIAYKPVDEFFERQHLVEELIFLGFLGMIDPPRDGVKEAVEECRLAGIQTIMITGDHANTALAIAKELNISTNGTILTGEQLDTMNDEELDSNIDNVEVYARVSPAHKLRIVESFRKKKKIVAMTGDGINDAPALKRADVGIAMGIKGTDVTKESGNVILTDDNFISIVGAVEEGRIMFSNIKKYLMYLLSSNLGEILLLGLAVLLGMELPLIAIQILYVNLATDGLPALALAVDPPEGDYMKQPPRNPNKSIFSNSVATLMILGGIWSAIINLSLFIVMLEIVKVPLNEARSMVFIGLILIQFFKAYNYRSDHQSIFKYGIFTNKWLNRAIIWELFLLLLILYVPFLNEAFGTYPLDFAKWIFVLMLTATIIPVLEFGKIFVRRQMAYAKI
jgi:Ca2+-transporting ATPase